MCFFSFLCVAMTAWATFMCIDLYVRQSFGSEFQYDGSV